MKTIILALIFFIVPHPALADDFDRYDSIFKTQPVDTYSFNYEWRDQDTVRAAVLVLGHLIDANQSKHIKTMPAHCRVPSISDDSDNNTLVYKKSNSSPTSEIICVEGRYEKNPIIGQNASNAKINAYFLTLSLLEILVSSELPQEACFFKWCGIDYRSIFQHLRILDTGTTINENRKIGLGFGIGF